MESWMYSDCQDLTFYPTFSLTSEPASFMDTLEDMRFLFRDKGQWSTHSRSTSQSISIYTSSQSPTFHRAMWKGIEDSCTHSDLHYKKTTLSLGNLNLLEWTVSIPVLCSKGRHCCYYTKQVACLFIASEGDTISKTVSKPALCSGRR